MYFLDIAAWMLFPGLLSALITGYIAHMNDRSLWRWMLFGFCVPFLAIFVAMFVTYQDQKRQAAKEAEQPGSSDRPRR
jgi:MFS family permease